MPRPRKYPTELIERGVRLAIESGRPIAHVAADIGLPSETLRKAVRQAEADQGLRPGMPTSEEREEIKALKRENTELRRANEIPQGGQRVFRGRARYEPTEVTAFIDQNRGRFGVEPIYRTLDVSASAYDRETYRFVWSRGALRSLDLLEEDLVLTGLAWSRLPPGLL
jgi:transposase